MNHRNFRCARASIGIVPALAAAWLSTACGAGVEAGDPGADGEDVTHTAEAMNGGIDYPDSSCDAFKPLIQASANRALSHVRSATMVPCLAQHFLSSTNGHSAETIVENMRQNLRTSVTCVNLGTSANADALVVAPGQPEVLRLNVLRLPSMSEAQLASILLHEIAHRKGHRHSAGGVGSEFNFGVNEQIEACSLAMSGQPDPGPFPGPVPYPNGPRVDELAHGTFLSHVGGNGGGRATRTCYSGGFARGLHGRAGARIDALSLVCTDRGGNGGELLPLSGGTGGLPFTQDCGHGRVMVGIMGNADHIVNRIVPLCGDAAAVLAGTQSATTRHAMVGSITGPAFTRVCPAGKAVKSVQLRNGTLIDQLELECERLSGGLNQTQRLLAPVGTTALGTFYRERCPVGSVMDGLNGFDDGTTIQRLGGSCLQVRDDGASVSVLPFNPAPICDPTCRGRDTTIPLAAQGGFNGNAWPAAQEKCPSGWALVGMTFQAGKDNSSPIQRVRGTCANVIDWSTPNRSVTFQNLPDHGGAPITPAIQTLTCQRQEFLVGWEIKANESGVYHVQPVCRAPHESGAGQTCESRCDPNCTQNVVRGEDPLKIAECIADCKARCATN
jgi:hypothetical protein